MSVFIHLNGPPGVGKSTVARLFADRHQGILNLDVDHVVKLIGGWHNNHAQYFEAGRLMAARMAHAYLQSGGDVIMPQMITNAREMSDFEVAAESAGAKYLHIVLAAGLDTSMTRFQLRASHGPDHLAHINAIVEQAGGPALLRRIYSQLADFLDRKPIHATIDCDSRTPEQVCGAVEDALEQP